jgi:hypothetical protein
LKTEGEKNSLASIFYFDVILEQSSMKEIKKIVKIIGGRKMLLGERRESRVDAT